MRVVFLILMAVVILIGGGVGYFFFMDSSVAASGQEPKLEEKKASKAKKGKDDHHEAAPQIVELDALILPIIGENGVSQTISVSVKIEVDNQHDFDLVTIKKPRLADAFLNDMYGALSRQASLHGGVVKVDTIQKRLTRISKTLMGEGVVDNLVMEVLHKSRV